MLVTTKCLVEGDIVLENGNSITVFDVDPYEGRVSFFEMGSRIYPLEKRWDVTHRSF